MVCTKRLSFFLVSTPVLSSEKGFFVFGFNDEKRFASLFFSLPKWLALHFQNVCIIFLFIAQMGFFGTSGGQLGFWLEGLGARLGILWDPSRLGSFWGVPLFWDFGNTLKRSFLKVDPVLNQYGSFISWFWVSRPHVQSYRGSNSTQLSEIFIFIWAFTFASSLTFFSLLLKFKGTLVNLWFLFFDLFLNKVCFVFHVFAQSMRV